LSIYEIIGWTGSALFIVSYFLLSINKLKSDSIWYQLMNVFGAICLIVSAYESQDRPNMFTNIVWMCIGIYAVYILVRRKTTKEK